ncbi:M23 family metallopeptidase [Mesorhizobium sp.]|uniref:M23 family metallopeptidase n=1 Tax=Mesorhizobium sp. TaxID=1871066 RepID=UPI0025F76686|nr:M23 family metallopeptidase [Mesorhizobium sp.]
MPLTTAAAQQNTDLSYFAPGSILPAHARGVQSREVSATDWTFPLQVGSVTGLHAYIGTQLSAYHGLSWNNDPKLFRYPHRDNQCEPRKWKVRPCPSGKGHQGVDIRANDNSNRKWNVVAVEDGVVTSVTKNTTVAIRNGTRTVRYLHMDRQSIAQAGIVKGKVVRKGDVLGKVSNIMEGTASTSLHLHFDAHTSVAAEGHFYHVYPSLIAAYRRAWGLPDLLEGSALGIDPDREIAGGTVILPPNPNRPVLVGSDCAGTNLAEPLPQVDRSRFASLWRHNCSILGLIADDAAGARSFVYFQPRQPVAELVSSDPELFAGKNVGGAFSGIAKQYSSRCGTAAFEVSGTASQTDQNPVIVLRGKRPQRDSATCRVVGSIDETLEFSFIERASPGDIIVSPGTTPPEDRKTLSEVTRNFLAITFYPGKDGRIELLPYFALFTGLDRINGKTDSKGGLIPALTTDEGGVAISWVWIRKRSLYTNGLLITPRTLAHSMAGVDPAVCDTQVRPTSSGIAAVGGTAQAARMCGAVSVYLSGYIGFGSGRNFAADYFGRQVSVDETLNLGDPAVAWNWMRTMYSHESGRPAVIDRDTFVRGLAFGTDYVSHFYDGNATALRPVAFYTDACNFDAAGCGNQPEDKPTNDPAALHPVVAALNREIEILTLTNRTLTDLVRRLEQRVGRTSERKISTAPPIGGGRPPRQKPLY